MRKDKVRAHCPRCRHQQLFIRAQINHPLHIMLALCTAGLWLVSWAALCIGKVMRPWRCEHCGWHKPEFGRQFQPSSPSKPSRIVRLRPAGHSSLLSAESSRLQP
jgi:hypothetical protein